MALCHHVLSRFLQIPLLVHSPISVPYLPTRPPAAPPGENGIFGRFPQGCSATHGAAHSPQPTSPDPRLVQGFLESLPRRLPQYLPPCGPALSRLLVTALSDLLKVRQIWLLCLCPPSVCDPLKVETFVTAYKKDRFMGTPVSFAQICELEGERPVRVP